MGPLVWKMQEQEGARSRTDWVTYVNPGPWGHSSCSRVNCAVKTYQLHLLLHIEDFILGSAMFFTSFFCFSGIVVGVPAGYKQTFERKQYICIWKLVLELIS